MVLNKVSLRKDDCVWRNLLVEGATFAARSPSLSTKEMTILAAMIMSTVSIATRAATSHNGIERAASMDALAIASGCPGAGDMSGTRKLRALKFAPSFLFLKEKACCLSKCAPEY